MQMSSSKHVRDEYQLVIDKWLDNHKETELIEILKRGMWCCVNPPESYGGIMIAGINPSFDKYHPEEPKDCTFDKTIKSNGSSYWQTKHQMVQNLSVPVSYIDLFPLRLTKQDSFMNDSVVPLELKVELLKISQRQIEMIHPRLIVNPNQASRVYWGLHEKYSWMGYAMKLVDNPINKGSLYRIEGMKGESDVILPGLQTALAGSYFLQYKYHGNGVLSKEEYLTSSDVKILWDYLCSMAF